MNRWPIKQLIEKEGLSVLIYLALSLFLAAVIVPGVGTSSQAPLIGQAVAPWIFWPFQVLLYYFPVWVAAIAFPLLIIVVLLVLPPISKYWGDKMARSFFITIIVILAGLLVWFKTKENIPL